MTYFPPFKFDAEQGTLWRGSEKVGLTPKAAALLRCLLAGGGAWISKPAIMAAVWPDTHVQPDNIKVLVREIRQALGDSPRAPRFIRTAPGLGYAFVAPAAETQGETPSSRIQPGPSSPVVFVGREQEVSALTAALDSARASGRRLVLISGEQGVGKTALCDAFLRHASESGPLRACFGQCFERDPPAEPYSPLLDALLRLDRQHRGLVPPALARHAPSWLAHFPQWPGARAAPVRRGGMLEELAALFAALSKDVPLVLVVEELQWADAGTLGALTYLAASVRESKLLVVGTYCDEDWIAGGRARQRVMSPRVRASSIALGPLTAAQVGSYLDARFGPGYLSELAPAMLHATGGNPHMVRIACDGLIARAVVTDVRNGRRASMDVIARALPETLAEAARQLLDHLDPRERETLEAAAVVGREFTADKVAFALQATTEEIRRRLAPLARRGQLMMAVHRAGSSRAPALYRFRHALYADVIAQQAPMMKQQRLAERVGSIRGFERRRA